jgi:hypothetical protein
MTDSNALTPYNPDNAVKASRIDLAQVKRDRSFMTMTALEAERLMLAARMYAESQLSMRGFGQNRKPLTVQDVWSIMVKGYEVGFEPMASMDLVHLIDGKPTIAPQGMLALVYASGLVESIKIEGNEQQCVVTVKRKGQPVHVEIFTRAHAVAMGLDDKANWKKQFAVMLRWRCISAAFRLVFPDIIQGMYTPEELQSDVMLTEDGDVAYVPTVATPTQSLLPPHPLSNETPLPAAEPIFWEIAAIYAGQGVYRIQNPENAEQFATTSNLKAFGVLAGHMGTKTDAWYDLPYRLPVRVVADSETTFYIVGHKIPDERKIGMNPADNLSVQVEKFELMLDELNNPQVVISVDEHGNVASAGTVGALGIGSADLVGGWRAGDELYGEYQLKNPIRLHITRRQAGSDESTWNIVSPIRL